VTAARPTDRLKVQNGADLEKHFQPRPTIGFSSVGFRVDRIYVWIQRTQSVWRLLRRSTGRDDDGVPAGGRNERWQTRRFRRVEFVRFEIIDRIVLTRHQRRYEIF